VPVEFHVKLVMLKASAMEEVTLSVMVRAVTASVLLNTYTRSDCTVETSIPMVVMFSNFVSFISSPGGA